MRSMFRRTSVFVWALLSTFGVVTLGCQGGGEDDGTGGGDGTGGLGGGDSGTGGSDAEDEGCPELTGEGTEVSGTIDGQVTWTPEGSPYVISGIVSVEGQLTLEACTVVQLEQDAGFSVSGSMVARGTAEENDDGEVVLSSVRFLPVADGEAWGSIDVDPEGMLDLEVTGLYGGGAREATIHAWGEDQYGLPHRNVRTYGVAIVGSAGYGVMLETRAGFTEDSEDLFISLSGSEESPYPIYVEAGAVSSVPDLLVLEENVKDEILVFPFRQVTEDTFYNRGYPYRVRGPLVIAHENGVTSDEVSTLTIEPGVLLRMEESAGSGIYVGAGDGNQGRLVAAGTSEEPIRFESGNEEPAAGDWLGVYFGQPVATGNRLEYVDIVHAGATSGAQGWGCGPIENHASILILDAEPVPAFIENCTIDEAGGDTQILLGWDYDADPAGAAQAIFEANTFDAEGPACQVSLPQDETSQCPGLDSEPDCLP
jgi:hypothetical protein